ncbi:MAG: serine--tRNA ligase [Oscillospiraceae bacterium]|jgi:seryl-tRNA synthetase|nr:serine--tRNA ligase [Oscillospiraceae bacterium]
MLDRKHVAASPESVAQELARRGGDYAEQTQSAARLDGERRELLTAIESVKAKQNEASKLIAEQKRAGLLADELLADMKRLSESVPQKETRLREIEREIENILLLLPNIPLPDVPDGTDSESNRQLRVCGEKPEFGFEPKPHWELGETLGILDPATAAKVAGARFHFYMGAGARLERAVVNLFLDTHSRHGYTEVFPPFMANAAAMTGTGQLPKFAEDMFHVEQTGYYLIPTAEVPLTNMYRDDILPAERLPAAYCAYTACFRAEAGSAGRDVRGLIRQHQFNKVELVRFCAPEDSPAQHELLTADAERVLRRLGLPYRVVVLCAGDMGVCAAKTYDIEVWMPSYGKYVEISSCTDFGAYQARRANIRYRPAPGEKPQFVHTLNGSGVAVGRAVAALLENYQNEDGSVSLPEALYPYMGGMEKIERAKRA